jgi:hypothetical protein
MTPSQRLRNDINQLVYLARRAPPDGDGQGWRHHAQNIDRILAEIDQEFFRLSQQLEQHDFSPARLHERIAELRERHKDDAVYESELRTMLIATGSRMLCGDPWEQQEQMETAKTIDKLLGFGARGTRDSAAAATPEGDG